MGVLIILTALSAGCASSKSRFGIIFSASLEGNQDIYRVDSSDFQLVERLTFTPDNYEQSLIATKNGEWIVFYVPELSPERILPETPVRAHTYSMNTETREITDISGVYSDLIPRSWSVDETEIVLTQASAHRFLIVNRSGTNIKDLEVPHFNYNSLFGDIRFFPDGKRIVYEEINFYGPLGLPLYSPFLYTFKSKLVTPLSDLQTECQQPSVSPTGKQILITCDLSDTSDDFYLPDYNVRILNVTDLEVITEVASFPQCYKPVWSPDGKQVIMVCAQDFNKGLVSTNPDKSEYIENNKGLFIVNSDGSDYKEIKINLPFDSTYIGNPLWTPDGQRILYIAGKDKNSSNIYIMNVDGSDNLAVTTQSANYSELSIYSVEP